MPSVGLVGEYDRGKNRMDLEETKEEENLKG